MGPYPPRVPWNLKATPNQSSIMSQRGLGFHTVRGGDHRFCPRVVRVIDVCTDHLCLDEPPGWRWLHEPQAIICDGASRVAEVSTPCGASFFRPRVVGDVDFWRDFRAGDGSLSSPVTAGLGDSPEGEISPGAPRPLIDRGQAGGRLDQWASGSENVGKSIGI